MTRNILMTNDDMRLAVTQVIKDLDNKEDIITLFNDLLVESLIGSALLIKLVLGGSLPILPKIGDQGYVKVKSLSYGHDKSAYQESEFCKHGFIPCVVSSLKPITSYCPIFVKLPDIGLNDKEAGICIDDFYPDEISDIYDPLPI